MQYNIRIKTREYFGHKTNFDSRQDKLVITLNFHLLSLIGGGSQGGHANEINSF